MSPVEVEEGERLQQVGDRVAQHLLERCPRDRAPAQAGDDGVAVQLQAREREPDVGRDDAAETDAEALLEDDDAARRVQRGAHRGERERPERLDAEDADRHSLFAQPVDRLLERADHRAESDDDRLRVFAAIAAHQPARGAAEARLELGGDARNVLERGKLLGVREVAHFHERLRPDHRADRDRLVGIEDLARRVRRQERVDLGLLGNVDALVGVREDEAVHAHHHRHRQLLGELERLDVQVERFLVGLGEQLQPAAVALAHRVAVVVPDVDRRADRAVGDRHDDR